MCSSEIYNTFNPIMFPTVHEIASIFERERTHHLTTRCLLANAMQRDANDECDIEIETVQRAAEKLAAICQSELRVALSLTNE